MFVIDLAVFFLSIVHISALDSIVPTFYSEDFVFPSEKSVDLNSCTFANGTVGRCVSISECLHARDEYRSGINPILCHFAKHEPIVCCRLNDYLNNTEEKNPTEKLIEKRKSASICDDVYSSAVPFKNSIPVELAVVPSNNPNPVEMTVSPFENPIPVELSDPFKEPIDDAEFHITVVGGTGTLDKEFPHMAALGWTENGSNNINWRCGGTLISHEFVLTAAHCVIGRTPPDIVRIGEKSLVSTDPLKQDFGIELIIGHPEYRPSQLYNDIALIKLNKSATITEKVRPACLWQGKAINSTDVTAIGYGHTEFGGKSSTELLKVDLKIFSNDECTVGYQNESSLSNGIAESQICAGDSTGEKDTCQGDSGGPIQVPVLNGMQTVYHVVGVTSFGKACATTLPGVYTRVSHYLDWIENVVWR